MNISIRDLIGTRTTKIIAGTVCVAMLLWLGSSVHKVVRKAEKRHSNDYEAFVIGGRAVLHGENIYDVRTQPRHEGGQGRAFTAPQWFAMFMVPFEAMGYKAAMIVWPLLNLAALLASSWCCLKCVLGRTGRVPWQMLAVPMLLVVRPLDSNFGLGQVNVLILAFISIGLYLYCGKRDLLAGLMLAAATLIKLTPALLIVYFAWKREWRVVAGAALGLVILALVVPMPVYGVRGGYDGMLEWLDKRVFAFSEVAQDSADERPAQPAAATQDQPTPPAAARPYVPGQSLKAIVYRLLTDSATSSHSDRTISVNVLSLRPSAAETIFKISALLLMVALGIVCFGRGDRADVPRTCAELSLVLVVMLLARPTAAKPTSCC